MSRAVRNVSNIEIDEISLVDIPANQHAAVVIAKRATQEEAMEEIEIFDESGVQLDASELQFGDVVFDGEGQAFEVVPENEDEFPEDLDAFSEEEEFETVGKSAFGNGTQATGESMKSFADEIREELSKAGSDYQRDEIIAKALEAVEIADARAHEAELIAKSEQDLRLNREYIEVAKSYNVPVDPEELGPVLKRMTENLSFEDCSVIAKALEASGDVIFDEIGFIGGGDNVDVYAQVEAAIDGQIQKSETGVSKAAAVAEFFDANADAYDAYLSGN